MENAKKTLATILAQKWILRKIGTSTLQKAYNSGYRKTIMIFLQTEQKIMCSDYPKNFKFSYETKLSFKVFLKDEE